MPKSNYALGPDGARHAVRALGSMAELVHAVARTLDPGRPAGLAAIDLARAREIAGRVAAELSAAEDMAADAMAERDQAALDASVPPGGRAAA